MDAVIVKGSAVIVEGKFCIVTETAKTGFPTKKAVKQRRKLIIRADFFVLFVLLH